MDPADRELFVRSLRDATERCTGDALDAALDELGWHDALTVDARDAVSVLFELQGEANATSSALHAVVGGLLPPLGQWRAPATLEHGRVVIDGLALGSFPAGALEVTPVRGLDPALGLRRVRGTVDVAPPNAVDWPSALAAGQRAIAHELVGAARKMLGLACAHALDRVQFGRPIAMFQAVRHRLADTLVTIETADAALDAAWIDDSPLGSAMAKALAGRGARTAARHCQQVLAGIGFTTEHDLHRYVRRVLVLDQLLGSSKLLTSELGTELLATRQLPSLVPL